MRARAIALLIVVAVTASCRGEPAPLPPPDLSREDLLSAVLDQSSVGSEWKRKDNPGPNTVQIGGKVGAASVRPVLGEATSAFAPKDNAAGFLSNTLLVLRSEDVARAVIDAHEDAALKTKWTQDRDDGGKAVFTFSGAVQRLPSLGDAMFAARLKAVITPSEGEKSEHPVEYVAFTVGPIVAFVVTQDAGAAQFARRLEGRVARLLAEKTSER